ncbi:MAG: 2-phospho-L-lactate guanylyltransferase [Chloroflexi bacterium]|nr:2-phospho-L-lactate guanylyltransferase [Chloroflexota bacterium]
MNSLMAIVPVKPLAEAKTRLAGVLDENERVALAKKLLERTLLKLTRARGIARVVVISRDETVLKIARQHGAWSIVETHADLNHALEQATRVCIANGARSVLIVPVDLPRVRVRDIEKIIALGNAAPSMVIAPAQRDGGTNALLVNPAGALPYQFGEDSFAKHCAAARGAGLKILRYDSDTVAFDLDLPEDWKLEIGSWKLEVGN